MEQNLEENATAKLKVQDDPSAGTIAREDRGTLRMDMTVLV
jgi:vacuolar-type H+-ATPase subunit E/Vma4